MLKAHLRNVAPCILSVLFHTGYINADHTWKNYTLLRWFEFKLKREYWLPVIKGIQIVVILIIAVLSGKSQQQFVSV